MFKLLFIVHLVCKREIERERENEYIVVPQCQENSLTITFTLTSLQSVIQPYRKLAEQPFKAPFHDIHQHCGTQIYESLRRRDLGIWLFLPPHTQSNTHPVDVTLDAV